MGFESAQPKPREEEINFDATDRILGGIRENIQKKDKSKEVTPEKVADERGVVIDMEEYKKLKAEKEKEQK